MIDVLEKTEIKLLRLSKQVTNNEYIITIIKDNQVMQVSENLFYRCSSVHPHFLTKLIETNNC